MPAVASGEMAPAATAYRVAAASEMTSAGSVPATTAAGMLRPSQSRRSRYRHAQRQSADGSHYISHGRVGHSSSPLFGHQTSYSGAGGPID
jgi:hypothetical protein